MEDVKMFTTANTGDGSGAGSGYGSGSGYGDGDGDGSGSGAGSGYGYGDGSGSGSGSGVKSIKGMGVHIIDGNQTVITSVRGNVAKGFILNTDLSTTPCYIVKENNKFAHGDTLRDAFNALQEKLYDNSTEEERISKFKEKFTDFNNGYPASELFVWHHILTGSCRMGREQFCKNNGIDIENDKFTIYEFIELTKDSYGGDIIKNILKGNKT